MKTVSTGIILGFIVFFVSNAGAQIIFTKSNQLLGDKVARGAASGDIDQDGDIDLIIGYKEFNDSDTTRIWLNQGDGTFILSENTVGIEGSIMEMADFNSDGYPDLVISHYGPNYADRMRPNSVWLNDGKGLFENTYQVLDSTCEYIQVVDFNNDTYLDINIDNGIWINDGDGNFTKLSSTVNATNIENFTLGDLDHDGDTDAIGAGRNFPYGAPCRVFFNDGMGNFVMDASQSISNSQTMKVLLEDLNGDSNPDAFIPNFHLNNTGEKDEIWYNDGNGGFTKGTFSDFRYPTYDAKIADFDNDGDLDVFTAYSSDQPGMNNYLWINDGDGNFSGIRTDIFSTKGVEVNDFNGDGFPDVLALFEEGNVVWFQGKNTAVRERKISDTVCVFPNPTKSTIYVRTSAVGSDLMIFQLSNLEGKIIKTGKVEYETIDLTGINKGTYVLQILTGKILTNKKIVID